MGLPVPPRASLGVMHRPMKREPTALADTTFDVLVVGGGIVGSCVAWDAALRGLRVALVERDDFCAGTSWNSLKTIHGGLRSLQNLDVKRVREISRERAAWLRIAPHLVEPLPVVLPTYRWGVQSRAALRVALGLYDALTFDRNAGQLPDRQLPRSRLLSRAEALALAPELEDRALTGGALFYDAQAYSPERLVLEVLRAAAAAGAVVANYVEVEAGVRAAGRIVGVRARDVIGRDAFEVRARTIVNAAGPAAAEVVARVLGSPLRPPIEYCLALNFVLRGGAPRVAFAAPVRTAEVATGLGGMRQLFFAPWRGHALVGTAHQTYSGPLERLRLEEANVQRFLEEVDRARLARRFSREEIVLVHAGLVPVRRRGPDAAPRFLRGPMIIDHAADGAPEAITLQSGKLTTARLLAELAVDRVVAKLGVRAGPCRTAWTPLPGAPAQPVRDLIASARRAAGSTVELDVLDHLVRTYGSAYSQVLQGYRDVPGWDARLCPDAPVIGAQAVRAVREEMAQCLDDVLWRRTELGARGLVTPEVRARTLALLGAELGAKRIELGAPA